MTQPPFGPYDAHGPQDRPSSPGPYGPDGPQDHVPGRGPEALADDGGGGRFSAFPFPSYTTRTANGSQVSVGGCCLPLPIGCLATTIAAAAVVATRLARARRP